MRHTCYLCFLVLCFFFFSSRRRHTRCLSDWSSDVCSSDLTGLARKCRRRFRTHSTWPSPPPSAGPAAPWCGLPFRRSAPGRRSCSPPPAHPEKTSPGCRPSVLPPPVATTARSEEHTSELQSLRHLVCRL